MPSKSPMLPMRHTEVPSIVNPHNSPRLAGQGARDHRENSSPPNASSRRVPRAKSPSQCRWNSRGGCCSGWAAWIGIASLRLAWVHSENQNQYVSGGWIGRAECKAIRSLHVTSFQKYVRTSPTHTHTHHKEDSQSGSQRNLKDSLECDAFKDEWAGRGDDEMK